MSHAGQVQQPIQSALLRASRDTSSASTIPTCPRPTWAASSANPEVVTELQDAQAAVEAAQTSLDSLEADLGSAREQLGRLSARLAVQTARLRRIRAEYARAVAILEARVRSTYVDEPPDMLSFLVLASSFDELVTTSTSSNALGSRIETSSPRWDERSARLWTSGARRSGRGGSRRRPLR